MSEKSALLHTNNLCRYFGHDEILVKALDQIDLTIESGEFTALVGPSGSGKSTLLQLLGGLDQPTSGQVVIEGQNIEKLSSQTLTQYRRDNIGFIFQAYNLIPVLTAEENIEYIMLLQGVDEPIRKKRAHGILEELGLSGYADRRPNQLSGGQQQRVAVARAMVSEPKLILADEPTANLDSRTGMALIEMMKNLNQTQGMTFVFSTHDQKIMDHASRLIHLEDGKIVKDEVRNR